MKTFKVVQQYPSIAHVRIGKKINSPIFLGIYQAATITSAVNKAAKDWNLPPLLLHATLTVD